MQKKFCFVIPCFNHGDKLVQFLQRLKSYELPIIIVDDGSDQKDFDLLQSKVAQDQQIELFRQHENAGKGSAFLKGIDLAAERAYTHAIQIDADGQHCLDDIPRFIKVASENPAALVTGIPVYDNSVPRSRFLGRYITTFWVWIETLSFAIKDSMCGFRVYPVTETVTVMNRFSLSKRMGFDIDIIVKMYWQGVDIINIPTKVIYPVDGLSNFKLLRDNVQISMLHSKLFFQMLPRIPFLLFRKNKTARHWSNKQEVGAYWGIKFLFTVYKFFGRKILNLFLYPVVFFFFIFNSEKRHESRRYLERINLLSPFTRKVNSLTIYKHFLAFGNCALDKLITWMSEKKLDVAEFSGEDEFQELLKSDQGAIFIGAHLGNLEYAKALSQRAGDKHKKVNAIVFTENAQNFNNVLKEINPEHDVELFEVNNIGVDTAIRLKEKISQGEYLIIVGDRTSPGNSDSNVFSQFLGIEAPFPSGPFLLAVLMECPVYMLFCMRDRDGYNIYFEKYHDGSVVSRKERKQFIGKMVQDYAARLEYYCTRYPLQWFNFFNFWDKKYINKEQQGV